MSENERWSIIRYTDTMIAWVEAYSGDIVVIAYAENDNHDFWNIYDSTGRVVEGRSMGPYADYKAAKDRVREDIPAIPE